MGHRLEPGLYALGSPHPDSAVYVTANYTLSFDALRSALDGEDAYLLVLDTRGINVWCAAGEGSFGTDELVRRIEASRLAEFVRHRVLVLPQLGAAGISAREVRKRSGFKVRYGPVRAADLPAFLRQGGATPEMRRVRFGLTDRLVVIPIELVHGLLPLILGTGAAFLLGGTSGALAAAAAMLAGIVLFPVLLPWIPSHDFSSKGFILGGLVATPFALHALWGPETSAAWMHLCRALAVLLIWPPVTAFFALNFTGSTTFTSRTGVRNEIFTYIPVMAWMFGAGLLLSLSLPFLRNLSQ